MPNDPNSAHFPSLSGQVALVTGAATGIGESIARMFAAQGVRVFLLDLDDAKSNAVVSDLQAQGHTAHFHHTDVRQPDSLQNAVDDALTRYARVDILINNAGIYPRRLFLDMSEAEWDDMQAVNLKGVYHGCKCVLPHMVRQRSGAVVNISSVTVHLGSPNLSHYVAAKAGVIGLTRSLAREMGPHNVRLNCITPGAIEVEREKEVATPQQIAQIVAQQCLQRRLLPDDVARVCLFLASPLSSAMTGQTLNVDGGLHLY